MKYDIRIRQNVAYYKQTVLGEFPSPQAAVPGTANEMLAAGIAWPDDRLDIWMGRDRIASGTAVDLHHYPFRAAPGAETPQGAESTNYV